MLDLIVDRRELKDTVTRVLRFGGAGVSRRRAGGQGATPWVSDSGDRRTPISVRSREQP